MGKIFKKALIIICIFCYQIQFINAFEVLNIDIQNNYQESSEHSIGEENLEIVFSKKVNLRIKDNYIKSEFKTKAASHSPKYYQLSSYLFNKSHYNKNSYIFLVGIIKNLN